MLVHFITKYHEEALHLKSLNDSVKDLDIEEQTCFHFHSAIVEEKCSLEQLLPLDFQHYQMYNFFLIHQKSFLIFDHSNALVFEIVLDTKNKYPKVFCTALKYTYCFHKQFVHYNKRRHQIYSWFFNILHLCFCLCGQ